MVNRSPTFNYQFRQCHIRNMAPTPTTVKASRGKQLKNKVPPGSAAPVVKQKRKVKCSKCIKSHFPPTGLGCTNLVTPLNANLSSTLVGAEEEPPASLSPVRPDPIALAAQAQLPNHDLINRSSSSNRPSSSSQSSLIPPSIPHPQTANIPVQDSTPIQVTHPYFLLHTFICKILDI